MTPEELGLSSADVVEALKTAYAAWRKREAEIIRHLRQVHGFRGRSGWRTRRQAYLGEREAGIELT